MQVYRHPASHRDGPREYHRAMHTMAALLRGINVGRAKRIAMADLRRWVESLGYTNVRTLLNSGNVVFETRERDVARVAARIEAAIAANAGFPVNVIVVGREEMATIAHENALAAVADNPSRLLVAFVREPSVLGELGTLTARDWSPEGFHIGSRAAYLWTPGGVLASEIMEASGRLLGNRVTTRNQATLLKLCAMMGVPAP